MSPSPARYDTYEWYRSFPTLSALANAVGANDWPTSRGFVEHPALVKGPWSHGQWANGPGMRLGDVTFGEHSTGVEYRELQAKWFAHWLPDAPGGMLPAATVFDAMSSPTCSRR